MANLLSIDGRLKEMFYLPADKEERSAGYESVDIGNPLVIRYLSFFLKHKTIEHKNELMISTYVKTTEEKNAAAEAINYYNPETAFAKNTLLLQDFGGKYYGHELIYYTKSYLGESIRLTTVTMELDKTNKALVDSIKSGISTVAGLPAFMSYLPYAAMATSAVDAIAGLINFINEDDRIIPGHNLDLHFQRNHARRLQSGRIVCIPEQPTAKFIGNYRLTKDNRLVVDDGTKDNHNAEEYRESSYFVIQINSEHNDLFEDFEHYQRAAELLELTNRGGKPSELLGTILDSFKAYNDIKSVRKIQDLSLDKTEEAKKRIHALYKLMSPDIQRLYYNEVDKLINPDKEKAQG